MWGQRLQWICISADKAFSSETVFTETFRYTSATEKQLRPSLFRVNLPSFTQDAISFISPPNTLIHTLHSCVWMTNQTKLLLMRKKDGNKCLPLLGLEQDLPEPRKQPN